MSGTSVPMQYIDDDFTYFCNHVEDDIIESPITGTKRLGVKSGMYALQVA